jgi:hypothetical protein
MNITEKWTVNVISTISSKGKMEMNTKRVLIRIEQNVFPALKAWHKVAMKQFTNDIQRSFTMLDVLDKWALRNGVLLCMGLEPREYLQVLEGVPK